MNLGSIFRVVQGWVKLKGNSDSSLIGNVGDRLKADTVYNGIGSLIDGKFPVMSYDRIHWYTHQELAYSAIGATTLANNAVKEFVFTTPTTEPIIHMFGQVVSSLQMEIEFYEGVSFTGGTTGGGFNKDRNSTNTTDLVVKIDPTTVDTATATQLEAHLVGENGGSIGGTVRSDEWLLKKDTTYLLRITSRSAGNKVSYVVNWHED